MKILFELAKFCLVVFAAGFMFYAYQYSMTQGIQTVIAAQPPMPKVMESPSFTFQDCEMIPLYGTKSSKPPCKFEPTPLPTPAPIQTISKAEAKKAGLWFLLSSFSLPLAFGAMAVAGYLLIKS